MSTPEPQMHTPAACKFLKLPVSECGVIVCQYFGRWPSFIKNCLQLTNVTDGVLPSQWLPYCETRGTAINKHQKIYTIVMGHVHYQPAPVFLLTQIPFFPTNWCWINRLTGFTGSNNWFNKFFGYCLGVGHPLMHICWISDYMQHLCLPLKSQIDFFNHRIKFDQIDVPSIINWMQSTSIFYDDSIYNLCHSHSHGTCIHPDLHLIIIYAPVTPNKILTCILWPLFLPAYDRGIPDFIVQVLSALAWHLINTVVTLSQPHTGKSPTSFPHTKNIYRQVTMQRISGTLLSHFYQMDSSSPQTCRPRTLALSLSRSRSLQTNL